MASSLFSETIAPVDHSNDFQVVYFHWARSIDFSDSLTEEYWSDISHGFRWRTFRRSLMHLWGSFCVEILEAFVWSCCDSRSRSKSHYHSHGHFQHSYCFHLQVQSISPWCSIIRAAEWILTITSALCWSDWIDSRRTGIFTISERAYWSLLGGTGGLTWCSCRVSSATCY